MDLAGDATAGKVVDAASQAKERRLFLVRGKKEFHVDRRERRRRLYAPMTPSRSRPSRASRRRGIVSAVVRLNFFGARFSACNLACIFGAGG